MDGRALSWQESWPQVQQRYEAWWQREVVDRVVISIRAPLRPCPEARVHQDELLQWWTDPERVIGPQEEAIADTYYCGDAFPVLAPVRTVFPAIVAAFLGAEANIVDTHTAWVKPLFADWETRPSLRFRQDTYWWRAAQRLLEVASERAPGRYSILMPDLNGPVETLVRLRGCEGFCIDLLEHEPEVRLALAEVTQAWYRYWQACHGIVHQHVGGYIALVPVWSELPATDLQCDCSVMVSSELFSRLLLPSLEQQTRMVGRTLFHVDGKEMLHHLDSILAMPRLSAIQWQPGNTGGRPMSRWLPLMRHVQSKGKGLWLDCEPWEVEVLLRELDPAGLCLSVHCGTPEEADALLACATRLSAGRQWAVPFPLPGWATRGRLPAPEPGGGSHLAESLL